MTLVTWLRRRTLREGQVRTRWLAKDLREDRRIDDLSRLDEDLVGVRRRRWGTLGAAGPPPWPDSIEYLPAA